QSGEPAVFFRPSRQGREGHEPTRDHGRSVSGGCDAPPSVSLLIIRCTSAAICLTEAQLATRTLSGSGKRCPNCSSTSQVKAHQSMLSHRGDRKSTRLNSSH